MTYLRPEFNDLKKRLLAGPKHIQVVRGPRQVGKTTLVLQIIESITGPHIYISAEESPAADASWVDAQWSAARLRQSQSPKQRLLLVIDEIQKVQNWSESVKKNWDADQRSKVPISAVLLGSSSLLLDKGLTESLAGRFEITELPHWRYWEMRDAFGLTHEQYVWFGGYPGAMEFIGDEVRWKDYVRHALIEPAITRDVLMMAHITKPALLRQVFEMGCLYSGQVLSYNKLLGRMHDAGNTTTIAQYVSLLRSAGLLAGLEKYTGSVVRQRASSPKFMAMNTALMSALSPHTIKDVRASADWGRWIETVVGAHTLMIAPECKLQYWRDGDHEVDYVIQKGKQLTAIEVKSGSSHKLSGLQLLAKRYPKASKLILSDNGMTWRDWLELKSLPFE